MLALQDRLVPLATYDYFMQETFPASIKKVNGLTQITVRSRKYARMST
jgi:hypothetical protein